MPKRDIDTSQTLQRVFTLDMRAVDNAQRTVEAALSSETAVQRWFGNEILVHEAEAINMERAASGLPMLWSHDHGAPIGRVENIRLDDDRVLRGTLRFSKNARASEVWQDVSDGFLRDISIGYRIDTWEESRDTDDVRVTQWTPLEASVVTVPADSRVGINRKHPKSEETVMPDERKDDAAVDTQTRQQDDASSELKLLRLKQDKERKAGAQAEALRRAEIEAEFDKYEERYGEAFADLRTLCLNDIDCNVRTAKDRILEAIADGHVSVNIANRQDDGSAYRGLPKQTGRVGRIEVGETEHDKFARGAELSLRIRSGATVSAEELEEARKGELFSMSPSELAREWLRLQGVRATGNREQIIGEALKRSGMSGTTGHFADILENVANKSMLDGFMQADETWQAWCQTKSIPDFKAASLLNLSLFSDLDEVREHGQYEHGEMSDIKESIQLATYGKLFAISRQALANDDLSALGDTPRAMGLAAAYKIGDIAYGVLTTNAAMNQDSTELFHANHSNLVASGAAPSVATLDAAKTAMALQTDPQGKKLGIRGRFLLTPVALETTAQTLIAATYDPAGTAGTLTPNPFQNTMQVVSDHRLDSDSATAWYVAAARNTVVVGFLNGQQMPYMESKNGWDVDGVEYKVRIDAAAAAADFRGLYKNNGA